MQPSLFKIQKKRFESLFVFKEKRRLLGFPSLTAGAVGVVELEVEQACGREEQRITGLAVFVGPFLVEGGVHFGGKGEHTPSQNNGVVGQEEQKR